MNSDSIPFISSIVHPTDFSIASEKAFVHALAIALIRQTEFTLFNVASNHKNSEMRRQFPGVRKTLERWNLLEQGSPQSAVFEQLGISVRKITSSGKNATTEVLKFLESTPVDLVVLATEGREGLPRWMQRSKAEAIAHATSALTLFVPNQGKSFVRANDGYLSLKRILIPVDTQPSPTAAIVFATRAAQILGVDDPVEIVLLHIGNDPSVLEISLPEDPTIKFRKEIQTGDPIEEILSTATTHSVDAVFMTTAGKEGILDVMRGTTTDQIVRKLHCPLLAIPQSWNK